MDHSIFESLVLMICSSTALPVPWPSTQVVKVSAGARPAAVELVPGDGDAVP